MRSVSEEYTDMSEEKKGRVLCGANSYLEKYYFNPEFGRLPEAVKQELQAMCVLFTEEAGGILTMEFDDAGNLLLQVSKEDADYLFDEIESELQVRRLLKEKEELLQGLELYYRAVFLGQMPALPEEEKA